MPESTPRVTRLCVRAVDAPLAAPVVTASGTVGSAPLGLIDLETDAGVVGRAYVFAYTPRMLKPLLATFQSLDDLVVGAEVAPAARAEDFARVFRLLGRQGLLGMALAGLDMALWDALGRLYGASVARLLGADERPLVAYHSDGIVDPARRADRERLEAALARGFTALKIRLGAGDLDDDVRRVAWARELIGPKTVLMVDYNQALSAPDAIRRIDRIAEYDVAWVEEPVIAEDFAGAAAVRAAAAAPIQLGENWWFAEDAARAIAAEASDFAMLDVMKIGGFTGWRRAAPLAEAAALPVSSHLFIEASAHALAATPNAHYLEFFDIAGAILTEPYALEDGALRPRGPGLGLEWDEAAVARYAV